MKIAYFELTMGDFYEDYSINPKFYGGGPCVARWMKEDSLFDKNNNCFYLFAHKECFKNIKNTERIDRCIELNDQQLNYIKGGNPLINIITGLEDMDIIIHHHTCFYLNTYGLRAKNVQWSGFGRGDACHPLTPYVLFYTPGELPINPNQKYYYVKIGKPVPQEFIERTKEDFVFSCQRNDRTQNTIEIADNCIKNNIKGIFAGRIWPDYNLLDYIDNKNTFYIGSISEEEKLYYTSRARMTCYLHKWETVFNQSCIESLGLGTPILYNNVGFFKTLIQNGKQGYYYNGNNFLESFELCKKINQKDCWLKAKEYNVEEMLNSFYSAFDKILKE